MTPEIQSNLDSMTALGLWSMLKQPGVLHLNILRGLLPLARVDALHLAGATDYDTLKAALEAARAENDSLQGEVNVLSREISQWEREADALRAENARLREAVSEAFDWFDLRGEADLADKMNDALAANETPTP